MTEVEDWKRQMELLEDDNFDLYKHLKEAEKEIAKLKDALTDAKTSISLLREAQQEAMEF